MGEARKDALRVDFDRLVKLEFHGSTISSDGGLFAYRQLDEAFGTKGVERAPAEVIRESIVFRDGLPTVKLGTKSQGQTDRINRIGPSVAK